MNKKFQEFKEKLTTSKIAIIGLGVSNLPLLEYLYNLSCDVTIFQDNKLEIDISKYNYPIHYGLKELKGFDIIFRSPGCLPSREELQEEISRGAYVTTEVAEVVRLTPSKVIGITGSDGKTTTTTLINLVLKANGYNTYLGGNIGTPLFTQIENMKEDDIVVLELSSFQLMDMKTSPEIAVITNISPNHLDKHKDYEEYIKAKENIFRNNDGILVLNYDNEVTNKITSSREIRYFSKETTTNAFYIHENNIYFQGKLIIDTSQLQIKGLHNYENICACLSAIYDMIDLDTSVKAITDFKGVEHRIEFVREINGVKWYNDSVSSSPTRTIAGLNSFKEKIVLIAGGYDKNLDYTPLAEPILKKVSKLILFGNTKDKIYQAVINKKKEESLDIYICNTLEEVVSIAHQVSIPKEIVLFSPASASFDMFKNFADRGKQFKDLVNKL
ncbi:MAG: UDP-N-acetylmuramoyl-L-alanine--D-glutamate ligase [Mycoplasmatota bacterium]|nr:UDP-N-acetylmuramoyl-L-alanine--D-glutamate ligase [Mycoplasmatota bacterium]